MIPLLPPLLPSSSSPGRWAVNWGVNSLNFASFGVIVFSEAGDQRRAEISLSLSLYLYGEFLFVPRAHFLTAIRARENDTS